MIPLTLSACRVLALHSLPPWPLLPSLPCHGPRLHFPAARPPAPVHLQGATGFGSAILQSLVWVCFTSAGVDGGSLQQSVVIECINGVVLAAPLLFLVDGFRTGDAGIVTALVVMQVGGRGGESGGGDESIERSPS